MGIEPHVNSLADYPLDYQGTPVGVKNMKTFNENTCESHFAFVF